MKTKIQIKSVFGKLLFEYESDNNTIKKTLENAVEQSADLQSADLRFANLQSADLRFADLRSTDLRSANLQSADLQSADLRFANLQSADLQSADLRFADLRSTDLRSANLRSADLDFSCLPLWCGAQFEADKKICQQLLAHSLRICELSDCGTGEMKKEIAKYIKGWHHDDDF